MGLLTALGTAFQSDEDRQAGNLNALQRFGMTLNDSTFPLQDNILTQQANLRAQGVTDPGQILSSLAQYDPKYAEASGAYNLQKNQSAVAGQNATALSLQNQQQKGVLGALAGLRNQGVTSPQQIVSALAQYDPQYAKELLDVQAKNPLAAAFSSFQAGNSAGNPQSLPQSTPDPSGQGLPQSPTQRQDPFILQPENENDKRNYDFLNSQIPPQYRALIRQISNGDESVGNADSLRSNGLLAAAASFDPSLSKTNYAERQATAKNLAPGGKLGTAITSANTAVKHLAQVALANLDLHNGESQFANYVGNKFNQFSGDERPTNLESTIQTVAPELAKAAASGGETTQDERKAQAQSFGISQSPVQALGAVASKADLINSKMEEVGSSVKNALGKDVPLLSPDNQSTLKDLKSLHALASNNKLDTPEAKAIISKLRGVVGQNPGAGTLPQGAQGSTATPQITPQQALEELKRRGKL